MSRYFIAIISFLLLVPVALGQVRHGNVTVAFGKVKGPDGKWRSIKGAKIPITIERIRAKRGPFSKRHRIDPITNPLLQSIYINDRGLSSYFYTPESPSELDDIVLSGSGNGAPWLHLTLGYHCGTSETILYRWRIWDRPLNNTPPGVNAFTDELADFGVYFDLDWPEAGGPLPPNGDEEAYKITFDITVLPPVVPDGECYFASQVRYPQIAGWPPEETGEGPFVYSFSPVFSGGGVSLGSSNDVYWHDYDPEPNGLYESGEADYFGGPPSDANLLLVVETGGNVSERYPTSVTMDQGSIITPEPELMHFDDNIYFEVDSSTASASADYPIMMQLNSSVLTTNITSYRFLSQSRAPFHGIQQVVEFWNYSQFRWVERSRVMLRANEDHTVETSVQSNLSQYVQTGTIKRIKARMSFRSLAIDPALMTMQVDRATWFIGTP